MNNERFDLDMATHLVRQGTITPYEYVPGYGLPKHFDLQDVGDDLFRLAIQIGVNESDIIVTNDNVSQRRKSLLYPLERYLGREGISEMLEFLIGGGARDKETVTVPSAESTDNTGSGDGGVDDGDDVLKFSFKNGVEVGGGGEGGETVTESSRWVGGAGREISVG
jgi:hypothetical protein